MTQKTNDTARHISLEAAEVQLVALATRLAHQLDLFLGSVDTELPHMITDEAQAMIDVLGRYQRDPMRGATELDAHAAARRIRALIPEPDPGWWRTALGRLVARADGYSHPVVPRGQAAAILGYTRQRISQLEKSGVLVTSPDGTGVTNESVVRKLRELGG